VKNRSNAPELGFFYRLIKKIIVVIYTGGNKMKSFLAKPNEVQRAWYVIDAEGKTLGRLATEVAKILRGKNKAIYTPHVDTGDYVIIVNAEKVVLTGKKLDQKFYRHHSGFPGGLKETPYRDLFQAKPTAPVYLAVKGMLPKNSLGRNMLKKLKVYAGPEHDNQAQMPQVYKF
jgi:large subunit ribosomal protein L13